MLIFFQRSASLNRNFFHLKDVFKRDEVSSRPSLPPNNQARPGWQTLTGENKDHPPGVIGTSGQYWREQRRFLLRNLKDFGFVSSQCSRHWEIENVTKAYKTLVYQAKTNATSI